jgi:hypothetical protein
MGGSGNEAVESVVGIRIEQVATALLLLCKKYFSYFADSV